MKNGSPYVKLLAKVLIKIKNWAGQFSSIKDDGSNVMEIMKDFISDFNTRL